MAFKLYHGMSQRKKNLFWAFLTMIAIFVFIIGDPISSSQGVSGGSSAGPGCGSRASKWFGTGNFLANVDGVKIDAYDVEIQGRKWYGTFMYLFLLEDLGVDRALQDLGFKDAQQVGVIKGVWRNFGYPIDVLLQNFSFFMQQLLPRLGDDPTLRQIVAGIEQQLAEITRTDKNRLQNLSVPQDVFPQYLFVYMQDAFQRRENLKPEMYVERQFWLQRAQEMGIVVSTDKMREDLLKFGRSFVAEGDLQGLAKSRRIQGMGFKDLNSLLEFMSEETRVMMAKGLLFNRAAGRLVQPTQFDVWRAYVKVMTELEVAIVPMTADNTGVITSLNRQPTEEELRKLYQEYKTDLPDPAKSTPGFRLPELFRLDMLLADVGEEGAASKYYQQLLELNLQANPYAKLLETAEVYQQYLTRRETQFKREVPFVIVRTGPADKPAVLEVRHQWSQLEEPALVAALAGNFFAHAGQGFPAVGVGAAAHVTTKPVEQDHHQMAVQLLLGFSGDALGLFPLPQLGGIAQNYIKFQQAYPDLLKEQHKRERSMLLQVDLAKLQEDLQKYSPEYRKAWDKWRRNPRKTTFVPPPFQGTTVKEYVENYTRQRGIAFASMNKARSFQTVLYAPLDVTTTDEKLLKQPNKTILSLLQPVLASQDYMLLPIFLAQRDPVAQRMMREAQMSGDQEPVNTWLLTLFMLQRTLQGQPLSTDRAVFEPEILGGALVSRSHPEKQVLHWKTEHHQERTPAFEECQDALRTAWTAEQLRPLVEAKANQLAERVRATPDGDRILRDQPGLKERIRLQRYQSLPGQTTLEPAALPLVKRRPAESESPFWQRSAGLLTQRGILENPPDDFLETVMNKLQKPGDVVVVANQPKTAFYVVYLQRRQEPQMSNPLDMLNFNFKGQSMFLTLRPGDVVNQAPVSLRDYAMQEKARTYLEEWRTFIRGRTDYNQEMGERLTKDLEGLMEDARRGG